MHILNSLSLSDLIEVIGIIVSFLTSIVAIIISVKTLKQNSKMIEDSTRPYVVVYNSLVNGGLSPIQFMIVKNFGQSAAKIVSLNITPKVNVTYSDELFANLSNQTIAPSQSYTTAFKLDDDSITLTASIVYSAGKKIYKDTFTISQKAVSDLTHPTAKPSDCREAKFILAKCFQDYLRLNL